MPSPNTRSQETTNQFEQRKKDHIRLSLDERNEALGFSGLDQVELIHEALPELDFEEIDLSSTVFAQKIPLPFLVSSMTAGHGEALALNLRLARACEKAGWLMGVGSQRRQLLDHQVAQEWQDIRKAAPKVKMLGNLGLSQLIHTPVAEVQRLIESLEAIGMIIHTNPLQEALQPEGTPHFKGGLKALSELCSHLSVPVVLKETGCGFSHSTLKKLTGIGLGAIDVSGFGGTHWGRIEGGRSEPGEIKSQASTTFSNWGISTVESLLTALEIKPDYEIWASGGVRSGLDAACLLAMGAKQVGFAKPILAAALQGEQALELVMKKMEFELKTALFCTGSKNLHELREKKVWRWKKT